MCQRIGNLSCAGTGYRFVGTIVGNGTFNHESANLSYSISLSSYRTCNIENLSMNERGPTRICRSFLPIALIVALVLCGCGESGPATFPVKGTVVFPDGGLLTEGLVEFAAQEGAWKGRNARGTIATDGSFVLSTETEGDGAVAGRHLAIVREPRRKVDVLAGEQMPAPSIDPKYADYLTSGLEFVVEEKENEFQIKITRPGT